MPLIESECRRPDFVEGEPIVLATGEAFHFRVPTVNLYPVIGPEGSIDFGGKATFGPDYDELIQELHIAAEPADQLRALFALAVDLLGRNYTLGPDDYARLLRYRAGDPESEATWQRIAGVATGSRPKA